MKLIFCILVFLLSLGEGVLHATETASSRTGKGVQKKSQDQKVTLKLLEPISPQRHTDEGEAITSNLGEILDDPKNEALKSIKVLGKKKRLEGPTRAIKIIWEEVSLDVQPTAEQAARGVQVPATHSLKEPVKRPLQSAFVQKAPETVQSGTPIEAKGDVDGLLAAARSLLIRAQRQGLQVSPSSVSSGLGVNTSSGRGPSAERVPAKRVSSEQRLRTDATQGSSVAGDQGARRTERSGSEASGEGVRSPSGSRDEASSTSSSLPRESHAFSKDSPFRQTSSSNSYSPSPSSFTSSRGSGFDSYQGRSPWPTRDQKRKHTKEGRDSLGGSGDFSTERSESSREGENSQEDFAGGEDSEGETASRTIPKTKKPGDMGYRRKGIRGGGPLGAGFEGTDAEFDYPFGDVGEGEGDVENSIPVIRVEYDYESCSPRVDFALKQVILQAKAITFQDGVKIGESECADTPKKFAIKKDYTHPDCADVVERNLEEDGPDFGFAYATYKPYWITEAGERHYLGDVQKEESHPFAIREEEGTCAYAVDLEALEAKPQSELIYENRAKRRVVVQSCRPSAGGTPVRITATRKGCGYVHQLDANRSMPQQRLVYSVKGAEYEALPCHDASDTWIEHQFNTAVCKPIVDEDSLTQQPFARRFIQTEKGNLWLSECEPYGPRGALLTDAAACSLNPYRHDVLGKQSYLNVRYYYNRLHGKKYVTGCQPGTEVFPHRKITAGYVHDDVRKISKLKVEVNFDHSGRKVVVAAPQVDETQTPAPYVKLRETTEPSPYQSKMNDRCYQERRFKKQAVYQRGDGTEYPERMDDQVKTVDQCTRTKEKMDEPCFVTWMCYGESNPLYDHISNALSWGAVILRNYGNCEIDGRTLWDVFPPNGWLWKTDRLMERLKTVYPDSPHPEYTPWEWTGYYRDHDVRTCLRGGDGSQPPVEGKRWHHTERVFSRY